MLNNSSGAILGHSIPIDNVAALNTKYSIRE
jgi:hypothetical protein